MNRRGRGILLFGFLVTVVVPSTVALYTDWLWFGETGFRDVFVRTWVYRATLGAIAMAAAFGAIFLNVRVAMRALVARHLVFMTREGPLRIDVDRQRAQPLATMVAAVVALLFGFWASSRWQDWLLFRHAQPFGEVDPVLGETSASTSFSSRFWKCSSSSCWELAGVSLVVTAATYVLAGALRFDSDRGSSITGDAKRHLADLRGRDADTRLQGLPGHPTIAHEPRRHCLWRDECRCGSLDSRAESADRRRVRGCPARRIKPWSASWWPAATAVVLYLLVPAGGFLAASLMQRFVIAPNELAREAQFIGHNIEATRKAFDLDSSQRRASFPATSSRRGQTSRRTGPPSATSGSGITSRCCRLSRRFRRFGRT